MTHFWGPSAPKSGTRLPSRKKIGGRLPEIVELQHSAVVVIMGNFITKSWFYFKKRLGPFWFDSNKRNFRPKISVVAIYWHMTSIFWKKAMFLEKSHKREFFEIEIFILNTFWNILNRFRSKRIDFAIFWLMAPIFRKMGLSPEKNHNENFFWNRDFHFKIHFGQFTIASDQKNFRSKFFLLKMAKIRGFLTNFGRNFFQNKIL